MNTKPCDFCGESKPVRVLDRMGYAPDELICEDCFSHDEAYWDCLPLPGPDAPGSSSPEMEEITTQQAAKILRDALPEREQGLLDALAATGVGLESTVQSILLKGVIREANALMR